MLKEGEKSFIFLIVILPLIIIGCGGGSGGGSSSSGVSDRGNGEGEITLAWDSDNDPAVGGYKIHYGRASKAVSGQYEHSTDVGMATQITNNTTSYTVKGLNRGETYYVAVTVYNKSNMESGFSNEVIGVAQ